MKPFIWRNGDRRSRIAMVDTIFYDTHPIATSKFIDISIEGDLSPSEAKRLAKWLVKASAFVEQYNKRDKARIKRFMAKSKS